MTQLFIDGEAFFSSQGLFDHGKFELSSIRENASRSTRKASFARDLFWIIVGRASKDLMIGLDWLIIRILKNIGKRKMTG